MGRHRLIIDGYNVLHAHPEYGALARTDLDSARARLVSDLTALASADQRLTVVFDGGGNPHSDGSPHHIGQLTIVFSPAGTTADTMIEALAHRARERDETVMVVTSDGATRHAVRAGSVTIRSSESFVDDIREAKADVSRTGRVSSRAPLSERIDPGIADVLARWARGRRD